MVSEDWKSFLLKAVDPNTVKALRKHERTGRPIGDKSFIEEMEKITGWAIEIPETMICQNAFPVVRFRIHFYGGFMMKTITFTDFRKKASDFITEVEHGETLVLLRRGKPVAEVVPYSDGYQRNPSWKQPGIHLRISGRDLSSAILEERETER
jgi:prevent-host-death family protein